MMYGELIGLNGGLIVLSVAIHLILHRNGLPLAS